MLEMSAGRHARTRRRRAVPGPSITIITIGVVLLLAVGGFMAINFISRAATRDSSTLSAAQAAYESGHFRSAEAILNRVVAANPDDLDARRLLAVVLSAEGKSPQAIKTYAEIVRQAPRDHGSWYGMATLERLAGDADASAKHLTTALSLKKGDFVYTDELARTQMELGAYDVAAKLWGGLLEKSGLTRVQRMNVLMLQGQAYQADKDYVAAKKSFEAALKLDPENEALQATVRSFE